MHAITSTRKFNPFDQTQHLSTCVHAIGSFPRCCIYLCCLCVLDLSSLISRLLGSKRGNHQMSTKCQKKAYCNYSLNFKVEIFFCYKSAIISHNGSWCSYFMANHKGRIDGSNRWSARVFLQLGELDYLFQDYWHSRIKVVPGVRIWANCN